MALAIACGILAGIVGFIPLFFALKLSRASESLTMVATAGQSLAGVFVSLVLLVVAMLLCAWLDRPSILPFGISEIAAFIAVTSVYFMWRNRVFRREKKLEDDSKGDLD